jgi:hypothetical protein
VHIGETANNGHIFSYVRSPDNLWYKTNDELVIRVNVDSVLADNNSYILCYARLLEKNINLSEPVDNTSRLQSARFRFSSTPIGLNGSTNTTVDDYSPVRKKFRFLLYVSDLLYKILKNSTSDIFILEDDFPKQRSRTNNPILNESPSAIDESKFNLMYF